MIQTETTPNPNSLKFLSENVISAAGTEEFQKDKLRDLSNNFIKELLSFKGVELVLLSKNFLSVKKNDDVSWNELKPMVISHLNHYFENNKDPILKDKKNISTTNKSDDEILDKLKPVYELIKITSKDQNLNNKDLIGFIGATWTLLVYMINKQSPKRVIGQNIYKILNQKEIIDKIVHVQKIHIKNQINNGASVIQIFDSWAGLVDKDKYEDYIYQPTRDLVDYANSLGVNVICFPRNIDSYKEYCDIVKPNAISIGYEADPLEVAKKINIPIQGGMNPQILLTDKENLRKEAKRYLDIFKDRSYIFNLGHGILPETDLSMIDYLVKIVKDY